MKYLYEIVNAELVRGVVSNYPALCDVWHKNKIGADRYNNKIQEEIEEVLFLLAKSEIGSTMSRNDLMSMVISALEKSNS